MFNGKGQDGTAYPAQYRPVPMVIDPDDTMNTLTKDDFYADGIGRECIFLKF